MKQKLSTIIVACFAFALCLAFAGCGALVDKTLYVGTWELQSSSDETFDSKTIELMKTLDVAVTLTLSDDGTGALNYLGTDSHSAKWQATSNTEGKITIDGNELTLTLEESALTLTDADGGHMEFAKVSDEVIEPKPAASSTASSASSASAASADDEAASDEAATEDSDTEKSGAATAQADTSEEEGEVEGAYDAEAEGDYAYDDGNGVDGEEEPEQ